MAKNNFTFQAALKLNSAGFKKGIADVQRSLKGLKNSFLSIAGGLGLGLGFNKLTSSLMDTATKLSVAQNTLRNVSKGVGEYGESMVWLRRISNEYGQDLIGLTNSFAQFRAAADSSNLSLDQMRTIYEALTRAAGAYHMSADRTNDMMNAVTQMLSKGKVAAEELRRQLGNSLPGAFNIMAEAAYDAGLITENSTQALEDAMRSGKIMAEQVLPAFAKRLNDITAMADFDSLQTSLNRFKNTWTEVVEAGRFENIFKGLVDSGQRALKFFTEDFYPKILGIVTGIGGVFASRGVGGFIGNIRQETAAAIPQINRLARSISRAQDELLKTTGAADSKEFDFYSNKIKKGGLDHSARNLAAIERRMSLYTPITGKVMQIPGTNSESLIKQLEAITKLNQQYIKLDDSLRAVGAKPILSDAQRQSFQKFTADVAKYHGAQSEFFEQTQRQSNITTAALKKLGGAWRTIKGIAASAGLSLAIGAVIGGITFLITKLSEARKEAKRIEGIADNMQKAVLETADEGNKAMVALFNIQKAVKSIGEDTSVEAKTKIINDVNEALGRTGDNLLTIEDDINEKVIPAIDGYINKLKAAAMQQVILSQVSSATSRVIQLQMQNASMRLDDNYGKTKTYRGDSGEWTGFTPAAAKLNAAIEKNNKEIEELNKGIEMLEGPLAKNPDFIGPIPPWQANENTLKAIYGGRETISGITSGNTNSKQATPKSVLDDYRKELQKLENQYKAGAILASDYKNQVETLNEKTFKELASFGWDNVMKRLSKSADKELADELKKSGVDKLLQGLIYDPETVEEADKLIEEEAQKAFEEYKAAWNRYLEYRKKNPTLKSRDADSDYMYSRRPRRGRSFTEYQEQIVNDDLEAYRNYVDDLSSYADDLRKGIKEASSPEEVARLNKLLDQVLTRLQFAKITLKDLKDKANVAQLEKDIEDLRKQGIESIFADITTISNGMDNLYRAIQSVKQINDSTWESEELENFLTVLNAIIQTLEVLKGLYKALQTTEEVYAAIKEKNAQKEIALNGGVALSEEAKAAASAKAAAAGAGAATAGIPVVGPLLAVAAVGSVVAAILGGMKKFATGGYVGGNSYTGDKQLARVNSGELILNPMQQRNLLNLANGKTGQGGQVEFKIKGADLVGTLSNYNRIQRGY